ncbi:MAG: (d)CMP kinase [Myxococcota bacterium]
MTARIIAIDGPAGAGKRTAARLLAARLGYVLLDTGALYRTVALAARREGIDWDDEEGVSILARTLVDARALRMVRHDQAARVELRGEDVSAAIRDREISAGASRVSAFPAVREALLGVQRQIGEDGPGVVAEGRDMGTVVFPDASFKFFLTASLDVRARRRHEELLARGKAVGLAATRREVDQRDHFDRTRAIAPLRRAFDAVLIDTSDVDLDAVVARMLATVSAASPREPERGRS